MATIVNFHICNLYKVYKVFCLEVYVGKEKKQETKMNNAANKENITPEKILDNQERRIHKTEKC